MIKIPEIAPSDLMPNQSEHAMEGSNIQSAKKHDLKAPELTLSHLYL